jgi:hypothetical protein
LGFEYLANHLASWGFVIVSINTNRGINAGKPAIQDNSLIRARGRMVLRHLSLLYKWFHQGEMPSKIQKNLSELQGKIDFSNVGFLGHSRGGQGVRVAFNLYKEPGNPWVSLIPELNVKAIYEIGATDYPTYIQQEHLMFFYDADGVAWNQLLPLCDADVMSAAGKNPFERMALKQYSGTLDQKSLVQVSGANHNFFNTEWEVADENPNICINQKKLYNPTDIGSKKQQLIAKESVSSFFKSHMLGLKTLNNHFNPLSPLPSNLKRITQIDRDYLGSPGLENMVIMDDFDQETGINTSGHTNIAHNIHIEHKPLNPFIRLKQRYAQIDWSIDDKDSFFESVWSSIGYGRDISTFATLDFRVHRTSHRYNSSPTTNFQIL